MFNRIRISTTLFLILILCGILQIGSNGMSFWAFRDDLQRLNQVEQSNQQRAALAQTRAVMLQASTALNKAGTLTALSYPADDIKTLMTTARVSLTQSTTLFKSFMAMTAGNEHVRALQKETEKSFARWHNDLEHQATWLESNQLSDFLTAPVQGSSALMRQIMTEIINSHSDMEMVATAPDPLVARDLIKKFNPDVLTLDVEMPRMDGLDFLEKLMRLRPMPVVMVSSLTGKGSEVTLRALELGAIDFVTKPQLGIREGMLAYSEMIAEKVRTAAKASLAAHKPLSAPTTLKAGPLLSSEKLIAIGASTGGTEAIRHVLQPLPLSSPALLITQHMPPGFTRSFADRLNKLCQIGVKEAEDGERVLPGHAYIAPGDRHMELSRSGANYQIKIHDGPAVNRHRPSVDVLFHSVAKQAGRNAVGVILTGMGNDGAAGMLAMRQAGAWTLAQNEASCVVFGMPREAINMGGVCEVVDLSQVSQQMLAKISAGQAIRI
ncbi:chemotaxis-specific protein-glutamate methyltransferase CheB [Escherichia coli]|nr:chemotaxis-specific protein-glutamate methyltransferase CheB [Escherichia coli]EFQ2728159.1 chemotaxis-specific protein-glutamate methyltransferase CheB [Escherichia coli]